MKPFIMIINTENAGELSIARVMIIKRGATSYTLQNKECILYVQNLTYFAVTKNAFCMCKI